MVYNSGGEVFYHNRLLDVRMYNEPGAGIDTVLVVAPAMWL